MRPTQKYLFTYDRDAKPLTVIKSGEKVTVETEDAFRGLIKKEEDFTSENINEILNLSCPLTGPIFIKDAKPGNWLEITINDITCGSYGITIIGEQFSAIGSQFKENKVKISPIINKIIHFNEKIKIPVRPMIGTIGTAPALEKPLSIFQSNYGGNMDCPTISIGNIIYLPVFVDGGYLFLGDVHAIQGDGEMINPFETTARIKLTINVVKEKSSNGKWPRIKTDNTIETLGCDRTFYTAAQIAMIQMVKWLVEDYGFSFEDSAFLCGQIVDARPCSIINSYHSARCVINIEYLN